MSKKNSKENVELKRDQMNLSMDDFLGDLPIEDGSLLDPTPPTEVYEHDVKIKECELKAKKVINSIFLLFFKQELLTQDEYFKTKISLESSNLKHILMSLEQLDHIIKNSLIISDSGDFNPKFLDSFANLQKTKMEVLKNVKLYVNDVRDEFKKEKIDRDTQQLLNGSDTSNIENAQIIAEEQKSKNIFRGTKDLMMKIRAEA